MTDLTPREIVSELDRFIIGQADAKRAVAVNREYGMKFHGAGSLGLLMLVSDSPKEREAIRAEAEAVIEDGAVGHSAAWFYQFAMQTAINHREWDNLDQFREAVQRIYPPEKSVWARFFVERSRVLEAWYRDQYSDALESRRQGLLEICRTREMVKSAQELESIGG